MKLSMICFYNDVIFQKIALYTLFFVLYIVFLLAFKHFIVFFDYITNYKFVNLFLCFMKGYDDFGLLQRINTEKNQRKIRNH